MANKFFAHPNCFAPPVVQGRLAGRHPKGTTMLWQVRYAHQKAALEARETFDRITQLHGFIANAESYLIVAREELASLTKISTTLNGRR